MGLRETKRTRALKIRVRKKKAAPPLHTHNGNSIINQREKKKERKKKKKNEKKRKKSTHTKTVPRAVPPTRTVRIALAAVDSLFLIKKRAQKHLLALKQIINNDLFFAFFWVKQLFSKISKDEPPRETKDLRQISNTLTQ